MKCLLDDFIAIVLCIDSCEYFNEVVFFAIIVLCITIVSYAIVLSLVMFVGIESKVSYSELLRFRSLQSIVMNMSTSMCVRITL